MTVSRQEEFLATGRRNQKQRTREAILDAATRLARAGQTPSIADVAKAARVSTATAYRYFPNPESLWADVAIRHGPQIHEIVTDLPPEVEQRIDVVIRRMAESQFADEAVWRALLRASLDRWLQQVDVAEDERVPVRGPSRLEGTRAALAPLEGVLPPERLDRLTMAVTLVWGADALVVTRDTCGLAPDDATDLMSWAARSLIRAALAEADAPSAGQA
ncbi:TetR/AcrR family transcriptional regulator [Pseudonocardia sp. DSM 110487]|jgi:AcrR family transcriptional regulator|uniref:TetR/AcrR family transcriptional regulator n=1 Tax=Pseudonocardia sp. DSM 110487 TaxID=2865833 RepID=UPI001C6A74CF|nr:TetR/AcrR family transcriptional regulator [Pseudonocardia sp. DSM 110487]QYN37107.1 TetR/AcrR family transcriptional regulator [Pseudonocardia sp. DSM 110487]